MTISSSKDLTQLLLAWSNGDERALDKLTPLVYDELRRLARRYLRRERPGHSLQATALVHEAFLRLIDQQQTPWESRLHFFGIAAQLMRQILVEHAHSRRAAKRGGGALRLSLSQADAIFAERDVDLVALDDALNLLARIDPQKNRLVELRFFSGLTIGETAEALGVSPATVIRQWRLAKAWLYREIKKGEASGG